MPGSDEFVARCAEPLDGFVSAVRKFHASVETLAAHREADFASMDDSEAVRLLQARHWLHQTASRVNPVMNIVEGGGYRVRWVAESLLGALALMAITDLSNDLATCDSCGQLMLDAGGRARYCSDRCKWRMQKRRQRNPDGDEDPSNG
jgi:hypothetical protein